MNPNHWLDAAERLLTQTGRGAPRQVELRCAVSMAYYGLFHWLAASAAHAIAGAGQQKDRNWVLVYRSLSHRQLRERLRRGRVPSRFLSSIRRFSTFAASMQSARHRADYDPSARFSKREALALVTRARDVLAGLRDVTTADRRDLAVHVLFRERPG